VFNAASKLYFTLAGLAIVVGFGYVIGTADRVGFTNLVIAGVAAFALAVGVFAFVPREPLAVALDEPAEPRPGDATDVGRPSSYPLLAALAVGLLAAGAALGGSLILLGILVGLIAVFSWFAQVWREHPSWTQEMTDRLNNRFIVPFGLPGTIVLIAGIGVVSLSRLFLAVSRDAAPVIGIVVAFALLGAFYLLSTRSVGRPAVATLATVAAGLVLAAGVAGALKGEREFHAEAGGAEAGAAEYRIAAENIKFDKNQLDFPASTKVTLQFENKEAVPHNLAIYDKEGGTALFTGETVNTEGEAKYEFTTPEAGSYYFQCDIHPAQMNGTVVVAEEASAPPAEGSGTNATTTTTP
jgi:plastocyanin